MAVLGARSRNKSCVFCLSHFSTRSLPPYLLRLARVHTPAVLRPCIFSAPSTPRPLHRADHLSPLWLVDCADGVQCPRKHSEAGRAFPRFQLLSFFLAPLDVQPD